MSIRIQKDILSATKWARTSLFDKDKVEKSHYHCSDVCCIGLGQKTVRPVLKRQDGKVVKQLKIKNQADNVLNFLNGNKC